MKAIILFMITALCSIFTINAQPYPVPGATQQPAWVFPIWIEDGSGQKDSVYLGYDPNSNFDVATSDTVFGEKWLVQPTNNSFYTYLAGGFGTILKMHVHPWSLSDEVKFNTNIQLNNAIWPITIKYDVSLFYADTLPFPDTLKPEAYAEFRCDDTWPNSDFNCNLQGATYYITDTIHSYFEPGSYIKPDSIVLTGNNATTSPNWMSINIYFKDIYSLISSVKEEKEENEFSISPNPAHNEIKISGMMNEAFSIKLFNLFGQQLFEEKNIFKEIKVPVSQLPDGLYLIEVVSLKYSKIYKFIKQ